VDAPSSRDDLLRLGQAVIRGIPDAVIYADRDGIIRFWNAGAERIFGFSAEEAVGQSLHIIIPERLRKRHGDGYARMVETGRSQHAADELLSVPALHKSGATLSIQFTVTVLRGDDGEVLGVAAVLRDVTPVYAELRRLRGLAG
jgi:PAS domain S-box-containing protein